MKTVYNLSRCDICSVIQFPSADLYLLYMNTKIAKKAFETYTYVGLLGSIVVSLHKNAGRIISQHVLIVNYFLQVSFLSCKITVGVMYAGCSAKNACLWAATRCSCWGTFRAIKQETCWSSFHLQYTRTGIVFETSHHHFSSHSFKFLHHLHLIPHLIEKPKAVVEWQALLLRIYEVSYSYLGP